VKTSSSKVVATSYFYLTVNRWIAGDIHISLLQVIVDTSNLVCGLNIASPSVRMLNHHEMGVAMSCDHLNFYILHCLMHLRNWWSQRLQI